MLTLEQALRRAPVHVIYIGLEQSFMEYAQRIPQLGRRADHVQVTFCPNALAAVTLLYETPVSGDLAPFLICNLLSSIGDDQETHVRYVGAIMSSGHAHINFVETEPLAEHADIIAALGI